MQTTVNPNSAAIRMSVHLPVSALLSPLCAVGSNTLTTVWRHWAYEILQQTWRIKKMSRELERRPSGSLAVLEATLLTRQVSNPEVSLPLPCRHHLA